MPCTYCMTMPKRMMSHRCLSIGHCKQGQLEDLQVPREEQSRPRKLSVQRRAERTNGSINRHIE
eukprot:1157332-Pelagomonas_calceolata.AAC.2